MSSSILSEFQSSAIFVTLMWESFLLLANRYLISQDFRSRLHLQFLGWKLAGHVHIWGVLPRSRIAFDLKNFLNHIKFKVRLNKVARSKEDNGVSCWKPFGNVKLEAITWNGNGMFWNAKAGHTHPHLFDKKMVTADKLIAMQFKKLTSQARIYSTQWIYCDRQNLSSGFISYREEKLQQRRKCYGFLIVQILSKKVVKLKANNPVLECECRYFYIYCRWEMMLPYFFGSWYHLTISVCLCRVFTKPFFSLKKMPATQ